MNKIHKIILIIVAICIMFSTFMVTYASTEIINEQATTINIDEGKLTKRITNINNNEITIELNLDINDEKVLNTNSEILFLIDDSSSMSTILNDGVTTRKVKIIDSTKALIEKINKNNPNVPIGLMNFASSSTLIQSFTNDKEVLINKCDDLKKHSAYGMTNMATALGKAKNTFSKNNTNKILVLLTDGLPTDGDDATKAQLQDENVYIISALVGLEGTNQEDQGKITSIFGTEANPTADRFYNIADDDIETAISNNIYNRLLIDFQSSLTNAAIKDYFPNEILNNFDITVSEPTKGTATKESDNITWQIPTISNNEKATLTYTLKLKDGYGTNLINKVINTNQKVEFTYTSRLGKNEKREMTDSPQIKVSDQATDKTSDNTLANSKIPNTGVSVAILILLAIVSIGIVLIIKILNSMKDIK